MGCTWSKTRPEIAEVGRVGKFTIYDLRYERDHRFDPDFGFRSVLVKVDKDLYREINVVVVQQRNTFSSSEIVNLAAEPILVTKFHDGGNNPFVIETLYMFRPSGLETPDFSAVDEAAGKFNPPNMSLVIAKNDYASMTYWVELYRNDTNLPRVSVSERGRITVTYRFVNGRAVVTGSKYEPYSQ